MKKLVHFIKEAFSSTYLQDIDALFRECNKRYEELTKDDSYKPWRSGSTSFNEVIKSSWVKNLRYDKIKDENFQEYAPDDVMMGRIVRKMYKCDNKGIAIGYKNDFPYVLLLNASLFILPNINSSYSHSLSASRQERSKQYEVIDLFKRCDLVRICQVDFDKQGKPNKNKEIYIDYNDPDSSHTREKNRIGMIYQGDSDFYRRLAEENIERYKATVAKNRANRIDDEEIFDKMTEVVNELAKINERYFALSEEDMTKHKYAYQRIITDINGKGGVMSRFWDYKSTKDGTKQSGGWYDRKYLMANRKELLNILDRAFNDIQALPF